jgi:Ca2+-binding EF-hand superfamily protein
MQHKPATLFAQSSPCTGTNHHARITWGLMCMHCEAGAGDDRVGVAGVVPPIAPKAELKDVKGICDVCKKTVLADQARCKNQRGAYVHAQCAEANLPQPYQQTAVPHHESLWRDALSRAEAAEGQLADLEKQNAALKKELEKANAAPQAARGQPVDASLQRHFVDWQMLDGCLQTLKQLDDTSLKAEFNQFADIHSNRLSKQGLAALFANKTHTLSEAEVKELMLRIDTSGDGEIDWHEFRALVRSSSELEMIFKGLPVERVLASCFARGAADDPLQPFFSQQHSDVVAAVHKAGHILVAMVAALIKRHNEARAKAMGAGGAKYRGEFKGATVEKFFEGVSGICGEPHPGV